MERQQAEAGRAFTGGCSSDSQEGRGGTQEKGQGGRGRNILRLQCSSDEASLQLVGSLIREPRWAEWPRPHTPAKFRCWLGVAHEDYGAGMRATWIREPQRSASTGSSPSNRFSPAGRTEQYAPCHPRPVSLVSAQFCAFSFMGELSTATFTITAWFPNLFLYCLLLSSGGVLSA